MGVDPDLLSADVDIFSDEDLEDVVRRCGFGKGQAETYIQVASELNFRTSPKWRERAFSLERETCILRFPHPIDILIAKLNRLEEKDLKAFEVVIARTGHPTEAELIQELQDAVDLFRPGFDEEKATDLVSNTRLLWRRLYKREIDPRRTIISVALERRRRGYDEPKEDLKQSLPAKAPRKRRTK